MAKDISEQQRQYIRRGKLNAIREYENDKYGIKDWFGIRDYAELNEHQIEQRLLHITMEKAHHG
jgi:hypothetical protein